MRGTYTTVRGDAWSAGMGDEWTVIQPPITGIMYPSAGTHKCRYGRLGYGVETAPLAAREFGRCLVGELWRNDVATVEEGELGVVSGVKECFVERL